MTTAEAAYTLLLMLSVVDGNVEDSERQVIRDYVTNNFGDTVDFHALEENIVGISSEELLKRFQQAAVVFYENNDQAAREHLMLAALELVMADGVMTDEETTIFRGLADVWELRFEALLEQYTAAGNSNS